MKIMAYKRENGEIGIRNHLLVLPSVVCANNTAQKIAEQLNGVVIVTHQNGCAEITDSDRELVRRTLIGYGSNPNVAACIVVGLGCEDIKAETVASEIAKTGKQVEYLNIQECNGTLNTIAKGVKIGQEMLIKISREQRTECDLDKIVIGLECGGSDSLSGISANPAIGRMNEKIAYEGMTSILSETPEHMGGEEVIIKNSASKKTADDFLELIDTWNVMAEKEGISCNFLSLGNMEGGLSTLEEKSLGCIQKAGNVKLQEVIKYAEKPSKKGLIIMDTPGADIESLTGLAAGGTHLICFSTGMGTPTACPICPTIKICSNPNTYKRMSENIDINAGQIILMEKSIDEIGNEIFDEVISVCNGKKTNSEVLGYGDFAIMTRSFTY